MTDPAPLSVVVIPLVGGAALASCLARLPEHGVECIVVLRQADDPDAWSCRIPGPRFVRAAADPVPLRRQQGIQIASGPIVALLEDTTWPGDQWCDAVRSGFADDNVAAVGGPITISDDLPARFQALGWSEYGAFTPGRFARLAVGEPRSGSYAVTRLPGNNLAYRRTDVLDLLRNGRDGLLENLVGSALRAGGRTLACVPAMSADYAVADHHGAALRTRLNHGRLYMASVASDPSLLRRAALLAKAAVLPPVLLRRTVAAISGSRPPVPWLRVMLWAALIETAWAAGEALGAVAGAGDSLERWR
ncbi:MAG: hypothetical protein M3N26_05710 [Pseudomonadota bacterium]|nr:hypothetical protein [Pseudomonadota bacterium]